MPSSADYDVVYTGTRPLESPPRGLQVRHAPLLEVIPLEVDLERLRTLVRGPAALVVFSKNAVRSLEANGVGEALEPVSDFLWWAVGAKTADFLERRFGVDAEHPERQNFEGMLQALETAELPETVVAFTLEGKPRDLSPALESRGIDFHQIPVYRTVPAEYPSLEALAGDAPWVVLTSPKAIDALADLCDVSASRGEPLRDRSVAAIGPKTADAAREHGIGVDLVPKQPDRRKLLEGIADRLADSTSRGLDA